MTTQQRQPQGQDPGGSPQGWSAAEAGRTNRVVVATVVVVLVIAAVVTAVVLGSQDKQEATTAGGSTLPKNAAAMGAGIVVNPGAPANVPTLDMYEDFQCPVCARFEQIFGAADRRAGQGQPDQAGRPPAVFLDDNLRNDSSNRVGQRGGLRGGRGQVPAVPHGDLPGSAHAGGCGYTDAQLKEFAQTAGITGAALTTWDQCYTAKSHNQWVESVQTQSEKDGVNGTPTIKLNGKAIDLNGLAQASWPTRSRPRRGDLHA